VLLVCAVLPLMRALAQTYSIDWFTIDGGGGTSTGGVYSVSGTLGQPDAGTMRGGDYSLLGGFWGVVAAQTPGAPLLSVVQTNRTISVYWPLPAAGFVLEQTMSVPNPPPNWSQVAFPYRTNSTHISITVPLPAASKFYRLRKL
jgi:hypothetical protein